MEEQMEENITCLQKLEIDKNIDTINMTNIFNNVGKYSLATCV